MTKTVKRITRVMDDKTGSASNLNDNPSFHSRQFYIEGKQYGGIDLSLTNYSSQEEWLWEKLGKPSRIRITITALDDE